MCNWSTSKFLFRFTIALIFSFISFNCFGQNDSIVDKEQKLKAIKAVVKYLSQDTFNLKEGNYQEYYRRIQNHYSKIKDAKSIKTLQKQLKKIASDEHMPFYDKLNQNFIQEYYKGLYKDSAFDSSYVRDIRAQALQGRKNLDGEKPLIKKAMRQAKVKFDSRLQGISSVKSSEGGQKGQTSSVIDEDSSSEKESSTKTKNNQESYLTVSILINWLGVVLSLIALLLLFKTSKRLRKEAKKRKELKNNLQDIKDNFNQNTGKTASDTELKKKFNELNKNLDSLWKKVEQLESSGNTNSKSESGTKYSPNPNPQPQPSPYPKTFYAIYPDANNRKGFKNQTLKPENEGNINKDLYKIEQISEKEGKLMISEFNDAHKQGLKQTKLIIDPVCDYQKEPHNSQEIITETPGKVKLRDGVWEVEEKVKVSFA